MQEPPERARYTGNEKVKKTDSRPVKRPERQYDAAGGGSDHLIILGITEYMRLVITAAGIKDTMESAVISTVNDNYNEVYHSVREGYAAGYEPDGESFSPSVDYGDIYSRMCFLLGLEEDGAGYVRINNGGEMEYRLSNLSVYIHNNALGAGGGPYYADASIRLEVPVRFAGKIITNMSINLKVRAAYTEKF